MTDQERREMGQLVREAVYEATPGAIGRVLAPMVRRETAKVLRRYVLGASVGYVILALGFGLLWHAQQKTVRASAEAVKAGEAQIRGLCDVRLAQRRALEQQWANTQQYLRSPAGKERNGLNDFVRRISVPQLQQRLRTETVPPACLRKPKRKSS